MTTIPDPDNPDTEGTTVPPYDGRKETADSGEGTASDDPSTAGAAAPTSSDGPSEPDPDETEGGATASPADEQPAQEESDDPGEGTGETGPDHTGGTGRAEDMP